jgi:hypothetical protein
MTARYADWAREWLFAYWAEDRSVEATKLWVRGRERRRVIEAGE